METKRGRFIRLAEARTNKILKMIELLGNLSNTSSYEYTEEEVNQIFDTIQNELNISRNRFSPSLMSRVEPFMLNTNQMKIIEGNDEKGKLGLL